MLSEAVRTPLFGQGFGTRISGFNEANTNAPILDNQWLDIVLEIGFAGVVLWMWLFVRAVRELGHRSRNCDGEDAWLFAALGASLAAFGVGMFTFDAFGFTQVFFVFWIILALAAVLVEIVPGAPEVPKGQTGMAA